MVHNLGEILIYIPCWWDGTKESLIATILFHRPDLVLMNKKKLNPIPLNYPVDFFKQYEVVDIGELMLATFPLSRQLRNKILTSCTWWMGEKYDGIRACWNASKQNLYTRGGIQLDIPKQFRKQFGKSFIDSEVWFGRGCFPDSQATLIAPNDIDYSQLRVVGFDSPFPPYEEMEDRYTPRLRCLHKHHLNTSLQKIIQEGGEGLILHKAKTVYESGRSSSVFKLKASRGDYEALVLSSEKKWTMLQLPDGMIFSLPSVSHPIVKQGDIVTLSFQNYSRREAPVNPKILRIRRDVSWEQVLRDFSKDSMKRIEGYTTKPQGYWISDKGKNTRAFLEEFAKNNKLDPLDAEIWYSIDSKKIAGLSSSALTPYNGSFIKALISLFPEVNFDETRFATPTKQYWQSEQNRRKLFDNFANGNGFDPLIADNWYSANMDAIRSTTGVESALRFYSGSITSALQHLYPDIGLQNSQFYSSVSRSYWKDAKNRVAFLSPPNNGLRLRHKLNI